MPRKQRFPMVATVCVSRVMYDELTKLAEGTSMTVARLIRCLARQKLWEQLEEGAPERAWLEHEGDW